MQEGYGPFEDVPIAQYADGPRNPAGNPDVPRREEVCFVIDNGKAEGKKNKRNQSLGEVPIEVEEQHKGFNFRKKILVDAKPTWEPKPMDKSDEKLKDIIRERRTASTKSAELVYQDLSHRQQDCIDAQLKLMLSQEKNPNARWVLTFAEVLFKPELPFFPKKEISRILAIYRRVERGKVRREEHVLRDLTAHNLSATVVDGGKVKAGHKGVGKADKIDKHEEMRQMQERMFVETAPSQVPPPPPNHFNDLPRAQQPHAHFDSRHPQEFPLQNNKSTFFQDQPQNLPVNLAPQQQPQPFHQTGPPAFPPNNQMLTGFDLPDHGRRNENRFPQSPIGPSPHHSSPNISDNPFTPNPEFDAPGRFESLPPLNIPPQPQTARRVSTNRLPNESRRVKELEDKLEDLTDKFETWRYNQTVDNSSEENYEDVFSPAPSEVSSFSDPSSPHAANPSHIVKHPHHSRHNSDSTAYRQPSGYRHDSRYRYRDGGGRHSGMVNIVPGRTPAAMGARSHSFQAEPSRTQVGRPRLHQQSADHDDYPDRGRPVVQRRLTDFGLHEMREIRRGGGFGEGMVEVGRSGRDADVLRAGPGRQYRRYHR